MSTPLPLSAVQPFQSLLQALRDPFRALNDRMHERLEAAGYGDIRPAHGHVMGNLSTEGNRASELAAMSQLTKQTMQQLIEDLERLGYVERVPDPTDARARLVMFTKRGRDARRAAGTAFRAIEREWAEALGAKKMERLRALLDELGLIIADRGK